MDEQKRGRRPGRLWKGDDYELLDTLPVTLHLTRDQHEWLTSKVESMSKTVRDLVQTAMEADFV